MTITNYEVGMLVDHPNTEILLKWGPGKIIDIQGKKLHIVFKNLSTKKATIIMPDKVDLIIREDQTDDILDNLPPLKMINDEWCFDKKRVLLGDAINSFKKYFPLGFEDAKYYGDEKNGERNYKLWAHQTYDELLGNNQARKLFDGGNIVELVDRALKVEQKVNLLYKNEKIAFKEALENKHAAFEYFKCFLNVIEAD